MKSRLLLPLAALLALPGCFLGRSTANEPLFHETVKSITPGMKAAEVVERMGAPVEVVQLGRRLAYGYRYTLTKTTGTWLVLLFMQNVDSRQDIAWFFFDENLALTHTGSSFQSHRATFHLFPWTDIYDAEDAKEADAERGLR